MTSPEYLRRRLDAVAQKRAAAEKALADARGKQARKESAAAGYRAKAMEASSQSLVRSYLRQADAAERDALALGGKIAAYSKDMAECSKQELSLNKDFSAALQRQAAEQERTRKRREADDAAARRRLADAERRARQRERDAERARTDALLAQAERRLEERMTEVRPPKAERLRILYVTAAPEGDLRVDKEIRRVEKGVQAATHRELVEIKHLSAATPSDFLDWLPRFRPHVVHFSGHAGPDVLAFDTTRRVTTRVMSSRRTPSKTGSLLSMSHRFSSSSTHATRRRSSPGCSTSFPWR